MVKVVVAFFRNGCAVGRLGRLKTAPTAKSSAMSPVMVTLGLKLVLPRFSM